MDPFETFEHAGFTIELHYDECGQHADPRDEDQIGTMVCWHPDYTLGDYQLRNGDGRGAVDNLFETDRGRSDFSSIATLARYCRTALGAVAVIPLYLYDHSGISMSAGSNAVGRGDTACGGTDDFGNPRGWDTTLVGVIYATAADVAKLCGTGKDGGLYAPKDWKGSPLEWVERQLDLEVREYSAWLEGQVYGFEIHETVTDEDGERSAGAETDDGSCWGFLPDVSDTSGDGLEHIRQEARATAENERDYRAKRHVQVAFGWGFAHGLRLSDAWSLPRKADGATNGATGVA